MSRVASISLMLGRLSIINSPFARSVAGKIATAAFLAPLISISPIRGLPPRITSFYKSHTYLSVIFLSIFLP